MIPPLLRRTVGSLVGARRVRALGLLTAAERERFVRDPRPERFLAGRMLLRELAAEVTGRDVASVIVTASCPECGLDHGAPRVPGVFVSLSHADEVTVAVAHPVRAVGVDIVRRGAVEPSAELRAVIGGDLTHWTRVEAVLKADGRGLRLDPTAVRVREATAEAEGIRYRLLDASDAGYLVTVAVADPQDSR